MTPAAQLLVMALSLSTQVFGYDVKPFTVDIDSKEVKRMKSRVADSRLPAAPQFVGGAVEKGITRDSLALLKDLWSSDAFDWKQEQAALNQYGVHYLFSL